MTINIPAGHRGRVFVARAPLRPSRLTTAHRALSLLLTVAATGTAAYLARRASGGANVRTKAEHAAAASSARRADGSAGVDEDPIAAHGLGEVAEVDGVYISVLDYDDDLRSDNESMLADGSRLIGMHVRVANVGSNAAIWRLDAGFCRDDGTALEDLPVGEGDAIGVHELGDPRLEKGQSASGWMTYLAPPDWPTPTFVTIQARVGCSSGEHKWILRAAQFKDLFTCRECGMS